MNNNFHDTLSEKQREVAEMIVDNAIERRRDKKVKRLTQAELADAVDVTDRTIRNWQKDPAFLAYLEYLSRVNIQAAMPDFAAVLIQNLEHGQNLSTKQLDLIAKVADWLPQPQSHSQQIQLSVGNDELQQRLDKLEQRIPPKSVDGVVKEPVTLDMERDKDVTD